MKSKIQSFSFIATLAVVFGMVFWGNPLSAQTTPSAPAEQQTTAPDQASPNNTPTDQTPQTQQPHAQAPEVPSATQQPPTSKIPEQTQSSSSDSDGGSSATAASGVQVFTGTVVKSGDKYVLKDDSGQTYDIDHQDEVRKFEGKRIRVHGSLDDKGAIQLK